MKQLYFYKYQGGSIELRQGHSGWSLEVNGHQIAHSTDEVIAKNYLRNLVLALRAE